MQRKRGELVPIGNAVSALDDVPVKALREASPPARAGLHPLHVQGGLKPV